MLKYTGTILILALAASCLFAGNTDEPNKTSHPSQEETNNKKIEEYQQKLAATPNDIETHRSYQNFVRQLGGLNNLKEEYLLKLNAEPQNPVLYYLYGRLTEGRELEDSFKRSLDLGGKTPNPELRFWLYFGFGQFYLDTKKYKEALQYLEMASKLRPDSLDVLHQTALVYYEMDNITEAMNLWDKILQTKKDYLDAFLGKALIYKSRGMYGNAIKELENVLKSDVAFWRAYEPLIQCCHAKQDYKRGAELRSIIKQLYKTTKDNAFKKEYESITIDIVNLKPKIIIVREYLSIVSRDLHGIYYFEIYQETIVGKKPATTYVAKEHENKYYLINVMVDNDTALKGIGKTLKTYQEMPGYLDLLTEVLRIEKSN